MSSVAVGEMSDKVKIAIIRCQTNYTDEECVSLLLENGGDYIRVIKKYMGIPDKRAEPVIKSVNQEIYKQLRRKLDIQTFNDAHPPTLAPSPLSERLSEP